MTESEKIMIEALTRIKNKSDMWQQVALSTASAKAIPPWWNLGDIAASALIKVAEHSVVDENTDHIITNIEWWVTRWSMNENRTLDELRAFLRDRIAQIK